MPQKDYDIGEEKAQQGQVSEHLGYLEDAVEKLTHTVVRVEDRLGAVLRVEDECIAKEAEDKALVPLADRINTLAMHVGRQTERLARILERLEL